MTSFVALPLYSPALVLLFGLTTSVGLLGCGLAIQQAVHFRLPRPWNGVAGLLLGLHTQSLAVQVAGMCGIAQRSVLVGIWAAVMAVGWWHLGRRVGRIARHRWREFRSWAWDRRFVESGRRAALPIGIAVAALLGDLAVALVPTTRWDEVYYHMLVPSRIVADGGLRFYRLPWEAAIVPQMTFQIGMAPLHALGCPWAASVVSWSMGVVLVWFAWTLIRQRSGESAWAWLWLTSLVAGYYSVVYWATGGPHATGDLATAAAVVAVLDQQALIDRIGARRCGVLVSLCLLAAVSTKITLWPLAVVIAAVFFWRLPAGVGWTARSALLPWMAAPWIIFYLPLFAWTFVQSGSPFGPVLAGQLGQSAYGPELLAHVRAEMRWHQSRGLGRFFLAKNIPLYTALFFAGVAAAVCGGKSGPDSRRLALLLLGVQTIVVGFVVSQYELRFYGGLLQGLVIHAAMSMPQGWIRRVVWGKWALTAIIVTLVVPWFTAQMWYASRFVPVSLGLRSTDQFVRQYVSFVDDYRVLDRLLPSDAVILSRGIRVNGAYAPRPIYLTPEDLPGGTPVFLMEFGETKTPGAAIPRGYALGPTVYANDRASDTVNARLGGPPIARQLRVYELSGPMAR
jgi:hypothetical protein